MNSTSIPKRPDIAGWEAAVSSDHPLATAAGADVLRRGGNAIDAAVTMAAVVTVTRPHMNGLGGDGFMLYRDGKTGEIFALNGSGGAGSGATPAYFASRSLAAIPPTGILSVSVPGIVRMWQDAIARFGTIPLAQAIAPAVVYAERGFPVSHRLSADVADWVPMVTADAEMARTYLTNGRAPAAGTILRQPALAASLRTIMADGADALYTGTLAATVAAFIEREGGLVTAGDLARHQSSWQEPIETSYRGHHVIAFPPSTQGIALLEQLNIAECFDLASMEHNSASYIHTLVQGTKLAFADRDAYVADPAFVSVPVELLASKARARDLAKTIGRAGIGAAAVDADGRTRNGGGDTIYLCAVDRDGNAVSWIQSIFGPFGSGRMVPETGIILHNRGSLFSLDPDHPNVVAPGKRPYHTLSPAMVLNADRSLAMVLGTPGADGQTQTLTQVINNVLLFGMTPQQAVDASRWRSYGERLGVESPIGETIRAALARAGHNVTLESSGPEFGGAQVIAVRASGALMAGADSRREGYAIAW